MKARHFILGSGKVTLWRKHVSEIKEQISELMRLLEAGDTAEPGDAEASRVNLWRSRRYDVFRVAREQKISLHISCRIQDEGGQGREQLLTAQVVRNTPLTVQLLDAPPGFVLTGGFFSYTFAIQEEDTRLEVSGTATVRDVEQGSDGLRLQIELLRSPTVRTVIDPPALVDCSCSSTTRLVPVSALPRTIQALRALLRQAAGTEQDAPRLHTISPTGATFTVSPRMTAQWIRSFDPFLVLFMPHFGTRQNIFIFQAQKTAITRQEDGSALLHLKFERSLKLDDGLKLQWLPLDRKGSKRLYRLVRDMAERLSPSAQGRD